MKFESSRKIIRDINDALIKDLNSKIRKRSANAARYIKSLIPGWIMEQPEVQSILSSGGIGTLNAMLGFPPGDGNKAIDAIIKALVNNTELRFDNINSNFYGNVEIYVKQQGLLDLLSLPEGFITTERGEGLHWLDWMLTKGDSTIIIGYRYIGNHDGRSGGGQMVKGSYFRIPPQFSGTLEDNFITRALLNRESDISSALLLLLK